MKLIAIAAVARNGVIGRGSELPWSLPEDMKFFRDSTRKQIVVMGRKTYQALGKALPQRKNMIITRDPTFRAADAEVFYDFKSAIDSVLAKKHEFAGQNCFIIGGAEIYALALPVVDELWLTEIKQDFAGDVFFPEYRDGKLQRSDFKCVQRSAGVAIETKNTPYDFCVYTRP